MPRVRLERDTESHFVEFCKSLKVRCHKLKLASEAGWPDRTLMYKGAVMFMELKRPGERPTPLQQFMLDQLTKEGFNARWSSDLEHSKMIVEAWRRHVDKSD